MTLKVRQSVVTSGVKINCLFLLYLRSPAIVITVGPYIEACCLDSVFGAEHCSLV